MENAFPLPRSTGGNEHTALIKLLAILFMIVDHVGVVFFPSLRILRYIGRLAFPLFAWGMVVGICKSRNLYRYALRLLLMGILSQPLYMLALDHSFTQINIFGTLLLGLCAIICIRERFYYSHLWGPAAVLLFSYVLSHFFHITTDYGFQGILLILLLYLGRKRPWTIAAALGCMCLIWWQGQAFYMWLRMQLTDFSTLPKVYVGRIQPYAIFALPLMVFPLQSSFRLPKLLGYAAYPLHLLVIYLVDRLV